MARRIIAPPPQAPVQQSVPQIQIPQMPQAPVQPNFVPLAMPAPPVQQMQIPTMAPAPTFEQMNTPMDAALNLQRLQAMASSQQIQIPIPPTMPAPPTIQQQIQAVVAPQASVPQMQVPPAPQSQSIMHTLDMGTDEVKNFRPIDKGIWVEAEIVKAEKKTAQTGNMYIQLQHKVTWPSEYVGCTVFDKVVLTASAAWKYKSACAACVDPNGNRLLSEDNRRFTGTDEQDFVGNVVRFKTGEPNIAESGVYNTVEGGYQSAFETQFEDDGPTEEDLYNVEMLHCNTATPPPVAGVKW